MDVGRLSPAQRRRMMWLVPIALLGAAAVGWSAPRRVSPPPAMPVPVFAATDGLPETLTPGRAYTATFRVTFPAGWADPPDEATQLIVTARGSVYCGRGEFGAAGQTVTLTCPFTAPAPGPLTLHLSVGGLLARVTPAGRSHDYPHTVA